MGILFIGADTNLANEQNRVQPVRVKRKHRLMIIIEESVSLLIC